MTNATRILCVAAVSSSFLGCISSDSKVLDVSEGCDEYQQGKVAELDIDPDAKTFVAASAEIEAATVRISKAVHDACGAIAIDLGQSDGWSGLATVDEQISNQEKSGACDIAVKAIRERVQAAENAGASIHLAVDKGECHIDYEAQTACDAECAAQPNCTPGPIETRCEPAKITAFCGGSCTAEAYCVGNVSLAAHCEGSCEGSCNGTCEGTCYRSDGTAVENDPACDGKCEGTLTGECFGHCKVAASAGIECGKEVRCQGGCTGELTAPACTTEYGPPTCEVNTECFEACKTKIASEAVCEPSVVKILITANSDPELTAVVQTLEAHLPALYDVAEAEGALLKSAGERMAESGSSLSERVKDLDGKALACVSTSSSSLSDTVSTLDIAVSASAEVKASVEVN